MFTELRIVASEDLTQRSYVCFYLNGKRIREYNGNNLGLEIKPNYAKTIAERDRLLRKLHFELLKALENNAYPAKKTIPEVKERYSNTTRELLLKALNKKLNSDLSKYYKRNMKSIHDAFTKFLSEPELNGMITDIKRTRIEEFLSAFRTSGTYYMNKRRDLGVLFSVISSDLERKLMTVQQTDRMRSKAKLHKIYEKDQLKPILTFLKKNHPNLHLCCLLSYGCFLRPHQEVRNLYGYHFKKDYTEIHLAGNENKGGRVRVVYIPDYVRNELLERVRSLKPDQNLFTLTVEPFNDAYFNTAWTRAWNKMFKAGLIQKNQTIYSFRHTAAVNVYHKTKDVHVLQKLLGHSDMIVTMKYLRGLGELNQDQLKDALPEL